MLVALPVLLLVLAPVWLATTRAGLVTLAQVAERLGGGAARDRGTGRQPARRRRDLPNCATRTRIPGCRCASSPSTGTPWRWRTAKLNVRSLSAASVAVSSRSSDAPLQAPQSLALPIALRVERLVRRPSGSGEHGAGQG
ncbi:MAG: hypothetical protein MZW92_05530 [Comamonadaceae bacterium]|nr:hypothetical protein [Comamonadaceae bacterium]